MNRIACARRWPCIVLAAATLAACDRSSVPLPERKTATPGSEQRNDAPAPAGGRDAARDPASVPVIPPDTSSGKPIDDAPSAPAREHSLNAADRAFVTAAAGANLYELEGGRLAVTKGVSPAVR